MPKVDPNELLTDRTKYPDEAEITLANGDTISVKEWRDRAMPKSDFTKASEGWSKREKEYQQNLDAANQNLARAMEAQAAAEARRNPEKAERLASGTISDEELLADPILGPFKRREMEMAARVEAAEKRLGDHEKTFMRTRFNATIADLKRSDPDLNVEEFLAYSQKRPVIDVDSQIVDLESTYYNYAHKRLVEAARKAGEEEGVKKGQATRVPPIPNGRRRAPVRPEGLPASLQELSDDVVMADPEIQDAMSGADQA